MTRCLLDKSLGFVLSRTARSARSVFRRAFKEKGIDLTPEQWAVLCRLWEEEGLTQRELAEMNHKDMPTMTRILDTMESKGLVCRERIPEDRRICRLRLTETSLELQTAVLPLARTLHDQGFAIFSDAEKQYLLEALNRLDAHLKSMHLE